MELTPDQVLAKLQPWFPGEGGRVLYELTREGFQLRADLAGGNGGDLVGVAFPPLGTVTVTAALDWLVNNTSAPVTSVNGQTGDVVLAAADVGADPAGTGASAAAAAVAAHEAAADPHPQYAIVAALTTDDLAEGATNLYHTAARAQAAIAALTTDDLAEGATNLYHTAARAQAAIAAALATDGHYLRRNAGALQSRTPAQVLADIGAEPAFAKGDLVAGDGVTLTGTLTGRLVGSGNVTVAATGGGGSAPDFILQAFGVT